MNQPNPTQSGKTAASGVFASLGAVLAVCAIVLLVRVVYLVWLCPYDLVEDEAHYWLWSKHVAWSYYSKGPGVAWAIWLSTVLFGEAEWAIRLPAAVASVIGTVAAAGLARDVALRAGADSERSARIALLTCTAYLLAPMFQLTALLMTIDGPYVACWAIAAWAAWRAMEERSGRAWIVLGAALGVGFLFKYTILLLIPGLLVYAAARRGKLALAPAWRGPGVVGLCLFAACLAPVLIWNAQHDWPTVRHLLGHLGLRGGDVEVSSASGGERAGLLHPVWTFELIGQELGMVGPVLILAAMAAWMSFRNRRTSSGVESSAWPAKKFLMLCAAPILLFYLAVTLIAEPEGNWPMAAYVTLIPLAAWHFVQTSAARAALPPDQRRFRWARFAWSASIVYGIIGFAAVHRADLVASAINKVMLWPPVAEGVTAWRGHPPKPIVTGRLIGAKEISGFVAATIGDEVQQTGQTPFVMVEHYGRASQLAYYLHRRYPGKVTVLCSMSYMGGRKSQFDFWPETDLHQPSLKGREAVLLSNDKPETLAYWNRMFDMVESMGKPDGEHKKDRVAYLGHGYAGPYGEWKTSTPPTPTPPSPKESP